MTRNRTMHARRGVCSILVLGALLSGCATARPPGAEVTFEEHEVVIGHAQRQTVLTGFLLGGAVADLAVVHIDENDDRRLHIYGLGDDGWVSRLDATLGSDVLFVDVANIAGRDRLITYAPERLNWFDPESATERSLVGTTCDFDPSSKGEVLHVDITRDVNGDGRDDLVLPFSHGFRVSIQLADGVFAVPLKVGPSTGMDRIYGADGYRYKPWDQGGRVHEMDYDLDGRSDLVFWNEDHFEVHRQDEHGFFAAETDTFTTDVAFDSDQIASLAAPEGVRGREKDHMPEGHLTGRVLHSAGDFNGDGIADLAVFALEGGSMLKMRSAYEVHFGAPASEGGTVFSSDLGAEIRSKGIPFGVDVHDFDGDGQVDLMFTGIEAGIIDMPGMIIKAVLTGAVSMDLELYRMEDGLYPNRPSTRRKTKADVRSAEAGGKGGVFPAVLIGDVNGDGRSDLLVGRARKDLRVYLGVPGPDLLARRPQKVAVTVPADEEYTWLVDLNRDGKQDILMHHPSTTEPHRVTMLIAR